MFLLGAGAAFPNVDLSDSALHAIHGSSSAGQSQIVERAGVRSRSVSLRAEYVQGAKGSDFVQARQAAETNPTLLGAEAAKQALNRAGISIEQVGLIIADTATPYQTCPSEAQRIGGAFGVKVPAYDVVGGAKAFPLFFDLLRRWKAERCPEYVLCVSTNTPSQHVNYGVDAVGAALLGDSAAAFVVSRVHPGKWGIRHTNLEVWGKRGPAVTVGRSAVVNVENVVLQQDVAQAMISEFNSLERDLPEAIRSGLFIGPELYAADFQTIAAERGIPRERVVSLAGDYGYSLGSSQGVAIASLWEQVSPGQIVVLLHCGDGMVGRTVLVSQ
jgi:3-oxoacyl-[acyl-carrier-protein] synthase-3